MTRTAPRGIPAELAAQMTPAVRAFVSALFVEIDQLRAEVRDLKGQLADRPPTPQNSSLPPSTQHPHAKPTPARPRPRKKRGGHRDWLWTFLDQEGVEPTNNASERSLRRAVIWRKLSFGTQSQRGSRFVETMLSVIETCRQQKRDVFAFVTAAVTAHFARQPTPLLTTGV